ncbi:MAG: hypothetical protein IPH55_15695 [Betaproteobacteria bacterium]|nr:hypothetical protein [Betaproteobacteria bacterium]
MSFTKRSSEVLVAVPVQRAAHDGGGEKGWTCAALADAVQEFDLRATLLQGVRDEPATFRV